jgi:hypothetical protein
MPTLDLGPCRTLTTIRQRSRTRWGSERRVWGAWVGIDIDGSGRQLWVELPRSGAVAGMTAHGATPPLRWVEAKDRCPHPSSAARRSVAKGSVGPRWTEGPADASGQPLQPEKPRAVRRVCALTEPRRRGFKSTGIAIGFSKPAV